MNELYVTAGKYNTERWRWGWREKDGKDVIKNTV